MSLNQKKRDSNILTHKAEIERKGARIVSELCALSRELEEWSLWLCAKSDNGDSDAVTLADAQESRKVYMALRADLDDAVARIISIEAYEGNPTAVATALTSLGKTVGQLDAKFD